MLRLTMRELETEAKGLDQNTVMLGAVEEAEPFYLGCLFQPNPFIRLPEPNSVQRLECLNEKYDVVWKAEQEGWSKLMLQTPEIDRILQREFEREFPSCYTGYVFIKRI